MTRSLVTVRIFSFLLQRESSHVQVSTYTYVVKIAKRSKTHLRDEQLEGRTGQTTQTYKNYISLSPRIARCPLPAEQLHCQSPPTLPQVPPH